MKIKNNIHTGGARAWSLIAVFAAASMASPVQATENGGSQYRNGAEGFFGCCALPPPGIYEMLYVQRYRADKLYGDHGQVVSPPGFDVAANAIIVRALWVTSVEIAGAKLAAHAILPLVDLDLQIMPGIGQRHRGAGDLTMGAGLGWQLGPALHAVVALDTYIPTGRYRSTDIANIGRNYWAVQPIAALTWRQREGLNADVKAMWTINARNSDTDYRSGQEATADYSLGWAFGNGWTVGIGGYAYQQVTNDEQGGATIVGNKGRAFAIGPAIQFQAANGFQISAKFERESRVRNRPGGESFWLKGIFHF
ncbi:transporter [Oxalobacteraceae bacterium OTU3CAMAD1]|nr:transporter [Oxalobacteraceae bacterium OTU3CAMAD1]